MEELLAEPFASLPGTGCSSRKDRRLQLAQHRTTLRVDSWTGPIDLGGHSPCRNRDAWKKATGLLTLACRHNVWVEARK